MKTLKTKRLVYGVKTSDDGTNVRSVIGEIDYPNANLSLCSTPAGTVELESRLRLVLEIFPFLINVS